MKSNQIYEIQKYILAIAHRKAELLMSEARLWQDMAHAISQINLQAYSSEPRGALNVQPESHSNALAPGRLLNPQAIRQCLEIQRWLMSQYPPEEDDEVTHFTLRVGPPLHFIGPEFHRHLDEREIAIIKALYDKLNKGVREEENMKLDGVNEDL